MAGPSKGTLDTLYNNCKLILFFITGIRLSFLAQADQNKYEMVFSQVAGGSNVLSGMISYIRLGMEKLLKITFTFSYCC